MPILTVSSPFQNTFNLPALLWKYFNFKQSEIQVASSTLSYVDEISSALILVYQTEEHWIQIIFQYFLVDDKLL